MRKSCESVDLREKHNKCTQYAATRLGRGKQRRAPGASRYVSATQKSPIPQAVLAHW